MYSESATAEMIDDHSTPATKTLRDAILEDYTPQQFHADIGEYAFADIEQTEELRAALAEALWWRKHMLDEADRTQWSQARNGACHLDKLGKIGALFVDAFVAQTEGREA